jgi:putative tricarboxylic transport membrane protein
MVNVVSGLAILAIAAVFWVQRNYSSQYGGLFPDVVLVLLAGLALVLVALGVMGRGPAVESDREPVPMGGLARAAVLLVVWIATLPLLGYVLGGVAFFLLTALLMRKERPDVKGVLLDLGVAVGVVAAFYVLFTRVLSVQLPEFAL